MNYNFAFWAYAYVLMLVVVLFAIRGVKDIKAGDFQAHMSKMTVACNLLIFFVVSYLAKVITLGREDKSLFSMWDLIILYTHEFCILVMLVSGVYARVMAFKFKESLGSDTISETHQALRRKHGKAGKIAVTFAVLGLFTASFVLCGMWQRG